ncbi:MAG: hypothetical protein COZ49_00590 [Candidatus Yonathbacteria bacterium CG_4_10_14_3_um_filter_47_65]|uniref:DUF4446 domain-containing protein n=2 Tax=Parcubacteria group TaxID=1794811 RepID=A0A2M8D8X1_9BACT|nr:MAG: hypothetical protein AUJ44_00690 [Candidatus Nomurabacteria bacterium CG1_02_47_685]PIP03920.1 MAG: hypothetical protein COX54_01775 [Candidatus Yonathbacteria bacterium CG23_combo_of_CG06-09_8_20_14_all_46_18]PIQ31307.1 MAG: hypothetical protein COW61_03885 [Candidatus Yonathbacteria bacterium CG17_big_fil_post_rev_8_21_14_2_50_46_19]PIX56711.1 MAG: hypothetical protein COZ49_00590 [Candidatus Yonathbacteria bacterium CG_4_10_14_3_um_filter_47_65]PIY57238.1 MAG: hypothetical protein CO
MIIETNTLLYIFIPATVILAFLVIRLELKMRKFLSGKNGRNLEGMIHGLAGEVRRLDAFRENTERWTEAANAKIHRSVQAIETERFNPFKGQGGNQSFATAFLDEGGNGVIISSLHSRDRISVFAKPIKEYTSEYELSKEEAYVLKRAHVCS